ncbi:MAG: cell division protein FtsL [Legionellales bacterium]|nr:cell division protein FtsL [Legionellales bacterium]
MNAAAKALAHSDWNQGNVFSLHLTKRGMLVLMLALIVLVSAVSVIYVKTLNRRLFSELQTEQQLHDQLQVRWGQLLLEQSTWATQARVQKIATEELHMIAPTSNNIVIVTQQD